ncbi:hypothetical protein L6164_012428 [Bauhinia variegata]|uniref:Uncharacterized protein n=1 Tax=Bauhinia variegata TaxID=167791 RepID=A0ACB9P9X4_BAUVA|nr:hypothetical protein L6164_012428 [Bauhinia variegata]
MGQLSSSRLCQSLFSYTTTNRCFEYRTMGSVKLSLRCPQRVLGISADPEPDWSFDDLVSGLKALELKIGASSTRSLHLNETSRELRGGNKIERGKPFKFHAPEFEMEDTESEDEEDQALVTGKRFSCAELDLSDSDNSDIISANEVQPCLMEEVGQEEGVLLELTHEHHLMVQDEVRNRISAIEIARINENKKYNDALHRIEKDKEGRRELDKKHDTQYKRQIAETVDNHLTGLQRERELKSQIVERKIRSDAAQEEAKRKEKALKEEMALQEQKRKEKAKQDAEIAEKANKKLREEQQKLKDEKKWKPQKGIKMHKGQTNAESKESGNVYRAATSALNLEHGRLQKLKELYERNQAIRLSSNKDYTRNENHIARLIRQIRGVRDSVRSKASELTKLLNDPQCPQSISIEIFARKMVSYCENPGNAAFASAYVIVLVASQVPHVMDFVLAEFHKVCIYTVPKHLVYKKSAFETKEAYFRSIGYRENDGKIEDTEVYLTRLESYMKLYGALVQTEIPGVENIHGLKEGWAWLARLLNALPPNIYTAVSLNAFLQMAGFALFRRYKSQFQKVLNIISDNFLVALKRRKEPALTRIIAEMQSYLEDKKFLQEPEGRSLQANLLSSVLTA